MIIIRVELLSAVTGQRTELAQMWIDNQGGTKTLGNYRARTLRGRSAKDFTRPVFQREGRVNGHARLKEHVWNLVAKALGSMGYGQNGGARGTTAEINAARELPGLKSNEAA